MSKRQNLKKFKGKIDFGTGHAHGGCEFVHHLTHLRSSSGVD
jgi:hypothetical protein